MKKQENILKDTEVMWTFESGGKNNLLSGKDIPEIIRLFQEADVDGSGALDMEEFTMLIEQFYGSVKREPLEVLHMQIDANCDGTVDVEELLNFLIDRKKASESLDLKNHPFPLPFKNIPVDHSKPIVKIIDRVYKKEEPIVVSKVGNEEIRAHQKGQYITINSSGMLTFWNYSFTEKSQVPLKKPAKTDAFAHTPKMHVIDVVYLEDMGELAVATTDRELRFYHCAMLPEIVTVKHALILDDTNVNVMSYTSADNKRIFSFGDMQGCVFLFISTNPKKVLFSSSANQGKGYDTVYISDLLMVTTQYEACVRLPMFDDICHQIRYFPSIESFALCGVSHKTMILFGIPQSPAELVKSLIAKRTKRFESRGDFGFFACTEYCPEAERLITGGSDGLLRVWFTHRTNSCEYVLKGHQKPVIDIARNHQDKLIISLSTDLNVRVWTELGWTCRQSFHINGMTKAPISSMCYNIINNELVVANTNVAVCNGRGTDVFQDMLTSHLRPLCSALYHNVFKQVISVCEDGVVTVWDILTGNPIMKFTATSERCRGFTAISFDDSQRKLVTVSKDGKVRLWNFNTGTELAVLSVTVPSEVTAIVCVNDRMFLSDRNSKIIYNLDMKGNDHRYMEHHYLEDISSLEYDEGTLISASRKGNIVIWDVETLGALYMIKGIVNPRVVVAGKRNRGKTGTLAIQRRITNINSPQKIEQHEEHSSLTGRKTTAHTGPLMKCLRTRKPSFNTVTLLTSARGNICGWSVKNKGGLLVKFRAVDDEKAVITAMSTDGEEQILLTGDSTGRICLWDIQQFGFKNQAENGPFENINGWQVSLCPPPVLRSWRAHLDGVVSVQWNPAFKNIITAGLDRNVILWSNTGKYIGRFGSDQWEATSLSLDKEEEEQKQTAEALKHIRPLCVKQLPIKSDVHETKGTQVRSAAEILASFPFVVEMLELEESHEGNVGKYKVATSNLEERDKDTDPAQSVVSLRQIRQTFSPGGYIHKRLPIKKWTRSKKGRLVLKRFPPPRTVPRDFTYEVIHKIKLKPVPPEMPPIDQGSAKSDKPPTLQHSKIRQGCDDRPKPLLLPPIVEKDQHTLGQSLFKPQPPPTSRTRGRLGSSQRVHHPPIPDKVQLTRGQTQLEPNSLQTSHVSYTCEISEDDSYMQGAVSAARHGSGHRVKQVDFPPALEKVQLTQDQTQFKPHPPKTLKPEREPLTIRKRKFEKYIQDGLVQLPPTLKHSQIRQGYDYLDGLPKPILLPPIDEKDQHTLGQSQFKPQPPPTLCTTGRLGSGQRVHLPPIPDEVRLTRGQPRLGPNPLQTMRTSYTCEIPEDDLYMQGAASAARHRSGHRVKQVHPLPVPEKVQLTQDQTQFKPQPPKTLKPDRNPATIRKLKYEKNVKPPTLQHSKIRQGCDDRPKPILLPPIVEKVQHTLGQSQFKPQPPPTLRTTGRLGSGQRVHLPPIPDKVKLT